MNKVAENDPNVDIFVNEIRELFNNNNEDSYNLIIKKVEDELKKSDSKFSHNDLNGFIYNANIGLLNLKIDGLSPEDYKEEINLRGKLIRQYKLAEKYAEEKNLKMQFRYAGLEQLKKQKDAIHNYKKCNSSKISIPEKLGLTVKEIGKTLDIFMKEKDVLTKVKNIVKETATTSISSGALMAGVGFAMSKFFHLPFSLSNFAVLFPVVAYSGLCSIIRNLSSKTSFEQYEYMQSDEFKKILDEFTENHKSELESIANLAKEKENASNEEIISINDSLVEQIDSLCNSSNVKEITESFELQALGYLRDNKEICNEIINEYLEEKNDDKEKYKEYNNKLKDINMDILKRENSLKDAIIFAGKNTAKNIAIITLAKLILSKVAPQYFAIEGVKDFIVPFAFAIINGIIDIPSYKNKLKFKETEYHGKIDTKNKERIEEILEMKGPELVLT